MPSKQPRLNVTVTPEQHALLAELGGLQGRSSASFLRELLDAAMPMLEAMLPVYRAAAHQVAMQPEALQKAIKEALAEVDGKRAQLDLLKLMSETSSSSANDLAPVARETHRADAREDARKPGKRVRRK